MTQAKRAREQALRERRERKQEKKQARAEAAASGQTGDEIVDSPEPPLGDAGPGVSPE
jgi:hypothetical protein